MDSLQSDFRRSPNLYLEFNVAVMEQEQSKHRDTLVGLKQIFKPHIHINSSF